jgi:crotonobetainyl-CoA:carnitine CoA-transferase CaiB-like acyl-CoA transferase
MSGLMSITGEDGRGPMRVGIAVGDVAAGMCAAVGILTALHERERSGEGQWVQTSLLEALLFFLDFQGARYLMKGEVAKQAGNNHPTGVPTGTFKTRDGYVNIAPTPPMWKRFCKVIGKPEWGEKSEWASPKDRRQHRETLNGLINEITGKEDTASVVAKMNAGGIPCGPVYDIGQAFNDPQVKHLGIAKKVPSKALGDITLIGQPVNLSRTKTTMVTGAPEYAEHADEILAEFGYSSKEIESFRKSGAI